MKPMLEQLLKRPIIPVIVIDDANDAEPLATALLEGGMDIMEVTFRTAAAADAIARIRAAFPEMLVGAGTVITAEQAHHALDIGVGFGVAPGLDPKMVALFQAQGTVFIPGVMSPSEVQAGIGLGCTLLKFFPAGAAGGVKMLQALAGPFASQGVRFCPTGGVNLDNMTDYLSLPIVSAIGGSWLATRQQIADQEWRAITQQTRDALARCP